MKRIAMGALALWLVASAAPAGPRHCRKTTNACCARCSRNAG